MAWNDWTNDLRRGAISRSTPPSLSGVNAALDEGEAGIGSTLDQARTSISRTVESARPKAEFEPAEFAFNDQTGEVMLPNGQTLKATAPVIMQLATLQSDDGTPLPRMQSVPRGWRPASQSEIARIVDSIEPESDFWGEAYAGAKTTLGLIGSAFDSMFGADDPTNSWSRSLQDLPNDQSIGQVKAGRGKWYSSSDSFLSQLGQTLGNVAGNVAGAIPAAIAGAGAGAVLGEGVGSIPGGLLGGASAVSGAASSFGEGVTDFYPAALDTLRKMDPATVERESRVYRDVIRENPGIDYDQALQEVAIRGARMAGIGSGVLGAAEALIGGKLAGNFLARMGVSKSLLGKPMEAVAKRSGLGATALRVGGRAVGGGLGEAAIETGQTMAGQSLGAATIGVGSTNPLDYFSPDEALDASLGGALFGAIGGRGHAADIDPVRVAQQSDVGAALGATPEIPGTGNSPWSSRVERSEAQDLVPAQMRRVVQRNPGPIQGLAGPADIPREERELIRGQLDAVLSQRFGADWMDSADAIAQDPGGRQLLGQYIAIERSLQEDRTARGQLGVQPEPAVDAGRPFPVQGGLPLEGGMGGQPMPMEQEAPADFGPAPQQAPLLDEQGAPTPGALPFNLRDRRAAQQQQQAAAQAASEQNPQALEQAPSRAIEQQIYELEDRIDLIQQQLDARPPRDPRRKFLRQAMTEAQAALEQAEQQWQEARLAEGPSGVAPGNRVEAPAPPAAPSELAPSGDRPMGVSPPPLENPIPMSPEEAASRAQTQQERGGVAPAGLPEQMASQSEQAVSETTEEPAGDVQAQVEALLDPTSQRDAVFLADGTPVPATPQGVTKVTRKGVGTLLTTNKAKADLFKRRPKLTDTDVQKLVGYSESKADALRSGQPTVVQARNAKGGVAAQQVASPAGVPAARTAVKKLAGKGAKVEETTPEAAQAERAARAPRKREKRAPSPPKARKPKADEEKTTAAPVERTTQKSQDDRTVADRAMGSGEAQAPATSAATKTIEVRGARSAETVTADSKAVKLPEQMVRRTGNQGRGVDLRAVTIDEEARARINSLLERGTMTAADRERVEKAQRQFDQLETMLDAAVDAATEQLAKRYAAAPEGTEMLREAEKRQLALENAKTDGQRGRPREKPRTSALAYAPLLVSETRGFLHALRSEAKAELASGYQPASSVARQMINALTPAFQQAMESQREGARILQAFASLSDQQFEDTLGSSHQRLMDSTVAKQVMRGATEVAHAQQRAEQDLAGTRMPGFADHRIPDVEAHVQPHATEHGELPAGVHGVVNEWVRQFEKGGNKFSAPIHVMSMRDAMKIAPEAFKDGMSGGKFIRRTDAKGNPTDYIIAVHWPAYHSDMAAIEALAHEFGHVVTTELYARADPTTRLAIDRAYNDWLARQQGRSVDDILRDQMPGVERITFAGGRSDHGYATSFWEWAARNAALYLMDPARPALSAVDKFFKAIADALRLIYEKVTGVKKPNRAWEEALDNWINGTLNAGRMPLVPSVAFNHVAEAAADEKSTETLAPLRNVFEGKFNASIARQAAKQLAASATADTVKTLGLSLETMRQIERQYRDTPLGPALSGWVASQQLKAQTARVELAEGSKWMEQALQLATPVRTLLERAMHDATHFRVHPDKAFTAPENAHLRRGPDRVVAVNERRYNATKAAYDAAAKADPRVPQIYAGLRDAFTALHQKTLQEQLDLIENANFTQKTKEAISKRIKDSLSELREGPYFPLVREGNWIVKVQMPSHLLGKDGKEDGEFFDTKAEARAEMRHQRALNPGAQVTVEYIADEGKYAVRVYQRGVYFFKSEAEANAAKEEILSDVRENYAAHNIDYDEAQKQMEEVDDGDGHGPTAAIISPAFRARDNYTATKQGSPEFLQEVRSLLDSRKLDPEVASVLEQLAVEALPENNYRKALLPRQNIFGASKQMLSSYAKRYEGAAHFYATVKHGKAINRNWQRAWEVNRDYAPAGRVLNVLEANQNEIRKRMEDSAGNRIRRFVTSASAFMSLGFSPAFAISNAMQPFTVTAPVLAGITGRTGKSIGMAKAGKYLQQAYKGAMPFFTKRGFQEFINESKTLLGQRAEGKSLQDTAKEILDKFSASADERAMLEDLLDRGTLDFSWLNALDDAMHTTKASQKWAALQRVSMAFPQQIETMNRVVTALSAYRLAKDEKLVDGEASLRKFADDIVADTQLDYSRMNRPLAFNKANLDVILQFKIYMQGMYMLFGRNLMMAFKGATPEERRQGRKTLAYLLASHAAIAGAGGLGPVAALAKLGLVATAMMSDDDDDKWKSGDQLMRDMLQDLFGEQAGLIAEKGLPALAGIDMGANLGIPMVVDPRFARIREDDTAAEGLDKWLIYSLGAPYSNFRRVVQGVDDARQGNWQQATKGLPSALRNVVRSSQWMSQGIVDHDGDTFIPRDELGWRDLGIAALGFQPLATSKAYGERSEVKQTMARITSERKRLLQADRTGEDVRDDIRAFNDSVPSRFRITSDQLSKSRKAKAEREAGAVRKDEAQVRELLGR